MKIQETGFKEEKKEIAYFMRRLYKYRLTTSTGGNISIKADDNTMLITPSQLDKARIKGRHIGIMSMGGENLTPALKPSMESAMHLAVYQNRPDVKAIVHAHPPLASSFTAMEITINCGLIAEAHAILGIPVKASYALMGTHELANHVVMSSQHANVILLENHGILCLAKSLLSAFERVEVLEAAAKMTIVSRLMGNSKHLNREQLNQIDKMMLDLD